MTVSADAAKAGPYTGNGSASSFAFDFKVFADTDIRVVETLISTAVETDLVLNTHYTVARNVDQDNNPGGSITYKVGGVTTALPATKKLTIVGDFNYEQPTDIPNGGAFFAQIVENALDRLTLLVKQLKERLDRAAVVPVSSGYSPEQFSTDIVTLAAIADDMSTVAAVSADVTAVATVASDVPTVAGIVSDVPTVAGIAADITAVAAVDTDVATCAANITEIQAAPSAASAAAASAAAAAATLASALWRDVVFVTSTNSPVALAQADNGKLYVADTTSGAVTFNLPQISGITLPYTVGVKLEAGSNAVTINRSGTDTIDGATSKTISAQGAGGQFIADTGPSPDAWTGVDFGQSTGNYTDEVKTAGVDFTAGTSTTLTLSNSYGSEANIAVHFDAAFQGPDTYSLSGTTLTFSSVIPIGVSKVYIKGGMAISIGVPGDATVTATKLAYSAVGGQATKATPTSNDELLLGDTGGSGELKKATIASVLKVVSGLAEDTSPDKSADFVLSYDSSAAAAKKVRLSALNGLSIGTAVASTSGTAIDFTGIPSSAKRITLNLSGVSTNGTSLPLVQIGDSGGVETSSYTGCTQRGTNFTAHSSGWVIDNGAGASNTVNGSLVISLIDASANLWCCVGVFGLTGVNFTANLAGSKSLSPGPLDRIRLTTVGGTDTFDAGTVNILVE